MAESGQEQAPQGTLEERAPASVPLSEEAARPLWFGAAATLLLHGAVAGLLLWASQEAAGGSGGAGGTLAFEIVMEGGGIPGAPGATAAAQTAPAPEPTVLPAPQLPAAPPAETARVEPPPAPTVPPIAAAEPPAELVLPAPPGPDPTLAPTPAEAEAAPPAPEPAAIEPAPVDPVPQEAAPAVPPDKPATPVTVPAPVLAAKPAAPPAEPVATASEEPADETAAGQTAAGQTAAGQTAAVALPAAGAGQGDLTASVGAEAGILRDDYKAQLLAWLQQHKRYPKTAERRRQQGIAVVAFTVAADGRVSEVALVEGSGYAALDEEALAVLRRAAPLPPFPKGLANQPMSLVLPVAFTLR